VKSKGIPPSPPKKDLMEKISIVDAPSILGLRPSGVENLPKAFNDAGFLDKIGAEHHGSVATFPYNPIKDEEIQVLNSIQIRDFSIKLADKVGEELDNQYFPIVLGGDCSIVIGCMLALRRKGAYGLFFIDGHADFYQPEASLTSEVADMDLAIITGRGPDVICDIEGFKPYVMDKNVVVFGYRDAEEQKQYGSQDVRDTAINAFDFKTLKKEGVVKAALEAVKRLTRGTIQGFWIHLDVDVLDDDVMSAVDYRLEGGISFEELTETLRTVLKTEAVGMSIAIFNPKLDPDGSMVKALTDSIANGFKTN